MDQLIFACKQQAKIDTCLLFASSERSVFTKLILPEVILDMPKTEEALAAIQAEHQKILAENREKERQRKARTHRLIEHGALFETYFPQTVMMNKVELVAFLRELAA